MIDKTFKKLIENSSNIVVFTGAGISTESGIPDFRSPTGIWKKYQPIEFSDFLSSETVRIEAWRRKFEIDKNISKAMPNIGHMAIVKLVESGKVKNIITQNIDNLHQESGIPNDIIIELHGNTTYAKCLDCGSKYNLSKIMKEFKETNKPPYCDLCSGIVKAATISFGQAMPEKEMMRAQNEAANCDLMIAVGSSLVVYPAATIPLIGKQSGAKFVILNNESTEMDQFADLVINESIRDTFEAIL